jgi:hypothetical protein
MGLPSGRTDINSNNGMKLVFLTVIVLMVAACNNTNSAKILFSKKGQIIGGSRHQLESQFTTSAEWTSLGFVGSFQMEQYIFSDNSSLSVTTVPLGIGERRPDDKVMQIHRP